MQSQTCQLLFTCRYIYDSTNKNTHQNNADGLTFILFLILFLITYTGGGGNGNCDGR